MDAKSINYETSRYHSPQVDVYLQETDIGGSPSPQLTPTTAGGAAGAAVMLAGAWLIFAALASLQGAAWTVNTAAVGLIVCASNLWRAKPRPLRMLLRTLGPWLFVSSLVLPHTTPWLLWNNLVMGLALVGLSFARDLGRPEARSMLTGA